MEMNPERFPTFSEARDRAVELAKEHGKVTVLYDPGLRGETRHRPYLLQASSLIVTVSQRLLGTLTKPLNLFTPSLEEQMWPITQAAHRLQEFLRSQGRPW